MVNEQNMGYKPFKMYFDRNGALLMDVCIVTPGQKEEDFDTLGDEIYGMLDLVIKVPGRKLPELDEGNLVNRKLTRPVTAYSATGFDFVAILFP